MELTDLTLEVRDAQLRRGGVVSLKDAELELRPAFCNVGTWSVTLPLTHPTVRILRKPGSGIVVTGPDKEHLLSGPMTQTLSKASSDNPEGLVTFTGITDDHVLGDSLAFPVPSSSTMAGQKAKANDIRSGPLESVMHSFVNANIGPAAPEPRRDARLIMGSDLGRGPQVKKSARFPKLGALLNEISALGDIGFRVIQRGTKLRFETWKIADRSAQIRMDLWNNTLSSYEATDAGAAVTHVFVAGQEEGVLRQLLERTSEDSLAQEKLWGRRIERFLDQRQTDDIKELEQAGDEVLAKEGTGQSVVKFTPMDEHTMRYLHDWNLGDKVTAVVEGREIAAIVSAAVIKVGPKGVQVGAILGGIGDTEGFAQRTEKRLSLLERNLETSSTLPAENVTGNVLTIPRVRLTSASDASPTSTGHGFQVGADNSYNLRIDNNEIVAAYAGSGSALALNNDGGLVSVGPDGLRSLGGVTAAGDVSSSTNVVTNREFQATNAAGLVLRASGLDQNSYVVLGTDATGLNIRTPQAYSRVTTSAANLAVGGTGLLARSTSAARYKVAVEDVPADWAEKVYALRPRTWHDKTASEALADLLTREAAGEVIDWDDEHIQPLVRIPGFVAEEVAEAGLAEFVTYDSEGVVQGLAYDRMSAALVTTIQAQKVQLDAQEERIAALERAVAALLA